MPWRKQEKEGGLGHAAPALYPVSKASNSGGWAAGDPGSWSYHEAQVRGEGEVQDRAFLCSEKVDACFYNACQWGYRLGMGREVWV